MEENYLSHLGTGSFDNIRDFSIWGDKTERYRFVVKLRNLYETVNGFFDSRFESYWEKQTGLPWKEWGRL